MFNDINFVFQGNLHQVDGGYNPSQHEASATRPKPGAPPPPTKPSKDHIEHLLSYRTSNNNTPSPCLKIPPPVKEKPKVNIPNGGPASTASNKKPKPQVPTRTVSLNSLNDLSSPDTSMMDDEPFPPPPPESELLANHPHLYGSESSHMLFSGASENMALTQEALNSYGQSQPKPNFAPADFPDGDSSSVSSSHFVLKLPETPKTPKPALKKSNAKKKHRKLAKSVTFSDSISLICEKQEAEGEGPPEIDYVAYVQNLLAHKNKGCLTKAASNPELAQPKFANAGEAERGNGYDSDFDEDTSDSEISVDQNSVNNHLKNVRCNLCRKHNIEMNELYCTDCQYYMSQFQPHN